MSDAKGASFDGLRKQAKRWLRSLREGDAAARERLEKVLPQHGEPPGLREVQQALARERGFESWAALKEHFEDGVLGIAMDQALVDEFLAHACIFSSGGMDFPRKWKRAERIRLAHPEIATASLHTAVVCGEVEHVAKLISKNPELVTQKGGQDEWEPLLFACYGRLPNEKAAENSLAIAKLLLDAGADPNTAFVTKDEWKIRFTALTGAMGHGEMNQPEHPSGDALARLLLERGAHANDSQGLYNTHMYADDTKWLELLFEFGLNRDDITNWHSENKPDDLPILDYLAAQAAAMRHEKRLRCLLEHGANPNARSIYSKKSAHQAALIAGNRGIADLLAQHGATAEPLEGHDAFVSSVRFGKAEEARALLRAHPEYLEDVNPLVDAAGEGNLEVVGLLLELGMSPNREGRHGHRALNNASKDRAMCEVLLAHGADPRARAYGGTPSNWARLGGDLGMARFLAEKSRYILDATSSGHLALVKELVAEDPSCVTERHPSGNGVFHDLPADQDAAQAMLELFLARGADPLAKNDAGKTPVEVLTANGSDDIADLLEATLPP